MCNNPEPKHGGKYCPGIGSEEVVCTTRRCNLGEVLISLSIYFSNLNKKNCKYTFESDRVYIITAPADIFNLLL